MFNIKFGVFLIVCLVLAIEIKGSCLEYGHSCWGGHGKRSGGKVYHSDTNEMLNTLLTNAKANANANVNLGQRNGKQTLMDNFDDIAAGETAPQSNSVEDATRIETDAAATMKNLLRKHNEKYTINRNVLGIDSAEQEPRAELQHIKRWRRIPLFLQKLDRQVAPHAATEDLVYYDLQ